MALALILIPLLLVLFLNLPLKTLMQKIALWLGLLLCLAQVFFVIFQPTSLIGNEVSFFNLFNIINISVDNLSLVLLLSIAIVTFVSLIVGNDTIKDEKHKFNFINIVIMSFIGMNGIVIVNDIFSLYLFIEITSISAYILIALNKEKDALEGSFKYLILSAVASVMMISSIAVLLLISDGTSFPELKEALVSSSNHFIIISAIIMFISGLLIKGGIIPFHGWLPDAYSSAPSSVSILLAGVITKTCGIYTIIRLMTAVFAFNTIIQNILLIAGALSIVIGAVIALKQKDFKRMLAYSSISQMGYVIISLAVNTPLGIAGAVFHLFNHSIFKSQLFVNAAAIEQQTGTRDMDRLGGLTKNMPFTGISSVIGILSVSGIPPLSGFWSKLVIIIALWTAGFHVFAGIAVLASLITLAYFLSLQRRVFFGKLADSLKNVKEASFGLVFAAVLLALLSVGIGVFFPYILNTFILPVQSIFH